MAIEFREIGVWLSVRLGAVISLVEHEDMKAIRAQGDPAFTALRVHIKYGCGGVEHEPQGIPRPGGILKGEVEAPGGLCGGRKGNGAGKGEEEVAGHGAVFLQAEYKVGKAAQGRLLSAGRKATGCWQLRSIACLSPYRDLTIQEGPVAVTR